MPPCQVSVVMPYYENQRTLRASLQSFANHQTLAPKEIILVDDGSKHPAQQIVSSMKLNMPVQVIQGAHAGQSAATNVGIRAASGDIILLTCADIVVPKHFVAHHQREHILAYERGRPTGVIGHISYARWLKPSLFHLFLSTSGPQFCFGAIADRDRVDGAFLYAPNTSVPAEFLRQTDGFDENLPYGFQDTDLGRRLAEAGLSFVYRPEALAEHDHPTDVASFMRRNWKIGHSAHYFMNKHPDFFPRPRTKESILLVHGYEEGFLQAVLQRCKELERRLQKEPSMWREAKDLLFNLYGVALSTSYMYGILSGNEAMADFLELEADLWQQAKLRASTELSRAGIVQPN